MNKLKCVFCLFLLVLIFTSGNFYSYAEDAPNSIPEYNLNEIFLNNHFSEPIKLEARIDVPLELNLQRALEIALKNNLDIQVASYKQDVSKWKFWENIGTLLPDYSLGLDMKRFDGTFIVGGVFPVMALTSNVNAFMRFDYRFFEGGRKIFNTLAAKNFYDSAKQNVHASVNDILLSVTKAYNRLLREKAKLDVLVKSLDEAQEEVQLNKNLLDKGAGTKFDVLLSESKSAEQEQAFIKQQAVFRQASIFLASVLNLNQEVHIQPQIEDLKIMDLIDSHKPVPELLEISYEMRPELKEANLEYRGKRKLIGVAFSDFLPRADFFGQYGGTGNAFFNRTKTRTIVPDAIALDGDGNPVSQTVVRNQVRHQTFNPQIDLTNITNVSNVIRGGGQPFATTVNDSLMTNKFIGLEVGWEIGQGLGLESISRINQARKEASLQKTALEKLKQNIESEVRSAYLDLQAAGKLLESSEKRIHASAEALRLAKLRLANGVGINIELLESQTQYTNALASKVDAITEFNNSQAELLHSLGIISIQALVTD